MPLSDNEQTTRNGATDLTPIAISAQTRENATHAVCCLMDFASIAKCKRQNPFTQQTLTTMKKVRVIATEPTPGEWEVVTTVRFNTQQIAELVAEVINTELQDLEAHEDALIP